MTNNRNHSINHQLRTSIKKVWGKLSDNEISFHETMRDLFFIAVREKYNIPRAQAEVILKDLEHQCCENAV